MAIAVVAGIIVVAMGVAAGVTAVAIGAAVVQTKVYITAGLPKVNGLKEVYSPKLLEPASPRWHAGNYVTFHSYL